MLGKVQPFEKFPGKCQRSGWQLLPRSGEARRVCHFGEKGVEWKKVSLETWEGRNKEPACWEVAGTGQQRQQQILQAGARQGWPEGILQTMASRLQLIRLGLPMTSAFPDFLLLPEHEVSCSECVNNFWVIIKKGGEFYIQVMGPE